MGRVFRWVGSSGGRGLQVGGVFGWVGLADSKGCHILNVLLTTADGELQVGHCSNACVLLTSNVL